MKKLALFVLSAAVFLLPAGDAEAKKNRCRVVKKKSCAPVHTCCKPARVVCKPVAVACKLTPTCCAPRPSCCAPQATCAAPLSPSASGATGAGGSGKKPYEDVAPPPPKEKAAPKPKGATKKPADGAAKKAAAEKKAAAAKKKAAEKEATSKTDGPFVRLDPVAATGRRVPTIFGTTNPVFGKEPEFIFGDKFAAAAVPKSTVDKPPLHARDNGGHTASGSIGQSVTVDFGAVKTVRELWIYNAAAVLVKYGWKSVQIEASTDSVPIARAQFSAVKGSPVEFAAGVNGNYGYQRSQVLPIEVNARYLRFTPKSNHGAEGNSTRIAHIFIFAGKSTGTPTPPVKVKPKPKKPQPAPR